ncbi:MAG: hypothetical protein ACFFD1_03435 [Candidatus Thorarchaeota archaeon]
MDYTDNIISLDSINSDSKEQDVANNNIGKNSDSKSILPESSMSSNNNLYDYLQKYKTNAVTPGFVVDSTFTITEFSDHIMTLQSENDSLRFNVVFSITQQANYEFYAELWNGTDYITYAYLYSSYFSPGTDHVVSLDFSGYEIRRTMNSGSFDVNLSITKYNDTSYNILPNQHVHTTGFYDYNWFSLPPTINSGAFTFSRTDIDSNGLFDYLTLSGSINSQYGGNYYVSYNLRTDIGDNIISGDSYLSLNPGSDLFQASFNAWDLNLNGYNGSYYLYMSMNYDYYPVNFLTNPESFIQSSGEYNWTEWDNFPITSVIFNSLSETDLEPNGLINSLDINLTVNLRLSGSLYSTLYIEDNYTSNGIDSESRWITATNGPNELIFSFSSLIFTLYGQNTSYKFNFGAELSISEVQSSSYRYFDGVYTSRNYTQDEWEPFSLTVNYPLTDYMVDTDSDGLGNYIGVDTSITINQPGTYSISAYLIEKGTGAYLSYSSDSNTFSSTGTFTLSLLYYVWDIFSNQKVWSNSLIVSNLEIQFYDTTSSSYISVYYNYTAYEFSMNPNDFDPLPGYLTTYFAHSLADVYGTVGLLDTLIFTTEIEITEPGNFYVCADLSLIGGSSISWECSDTYNFVTTGTFAVDIYFDISILSSYSTPQTLIINYLYLYSETYGTNLDSVYAAYTILDIDPSTIELLPALITDVLSMSLIDTDSNGRFNYLEFEINITVNTPGEIYVELSLTDNKTNDNCYKYFSSPSMYMDTGLQIIYIEVSSDDLVYCFNQNNPQEALTWTVYDARLYHNNNFQNELSYAFTTQAIKLIDLEAAPISFPYDFSSSYVDDDVVPGYDLVFTFKVNVSLPSNYTFTLSLIIESNGYYRGANSIRLDLPSGTQIVEIRFSELWHYRDINVKYMIDAIHVELEQKEPDYVFRQLYYKEIYIVVDQTVSYTDFDEPTVHFGNYIAFDPWSVLSEVVTINSIDYPVYHYVNLTFELVINQPTVIDFSVDIVAYDFDYFDDYWQHYFLDLMSYSPGIYNISIPLNSLFFKNNANYTIMINDLTIQDSNSGDILDELPELMTPQIPAYTYYSQQFSSPFGVVISITDFGLDTDSNGKFEFITINITMNIKSIFNSLEISFGLGNETYDRYFLTGFPIYSTGIQSFLVNASTNYYRIYHYDAVNMIKDLYIIAYSDYLSETILESYYAPLSRTYTYDDFDSPPVKVVDKYGYFVDNNSDGLFEKIVLELTVDSRVDNELCVIDMGLMVNGMEWYYGYVHQYLYTVKGIQTVKIEWFTQGLNSFSGGPLSSPITFSTNGYALYGLNTDFSTIPYDSVSIPNWYSFSSVDISLLDFDTVLLNIDQMTPVDLDANGYFDCLNFTINIDSKVSGELTIIIGMQEEFDTNYNTIMIQWNIYVNSGTNNFVLYKNLTSNDFKVGNGNYTVIGIYLIQTKGLFIMDQYNPAYVIIDIFGPGLARDITTIFTTPSYLIIDTANWDTNFLTLPSFSTTLTLDGLEVIPDSVSIDVIPGKDLTLGTYFISASNKIMSVKIYSIYITDTEITLSKIDESHFSNNIKFNIVPVDIDTYFLLEIYDKFGIMIIQKYNVKILNLNFPVVLSDPQITYLTTPTFVNDPFQIQINLKLNGWTINQVNASMGSIIHNSFVSFTMTLLTTNGTYSTYTADIYTTNESYKDLIISIAVTNVQGSFILSEYYVLSSLQVFRLAPLVTKLSTTIGTSSIYEYDTFDTEVWIKHNDYAINSVSLAVGSIANNDFVIFNMAEISDNGTHILYRVTCYSKNFNYKDFRVIINFVDDNSNNVQTTQDFTVSSLNIVDDLNPTLGGYSFPLTVWENQKINISFTVNDDRNVKNVTVSIKWQNQQNSSIIMTDYPGIGKTYNVNFFPNATGTLDITITVFDSINQKTSQKLTIIVNEPESPNIQGYMVSPLSITVGDSVDVNITFIKNSQVITSVSLTIDTYGSYALEKIYEDSTIEVWSVTITADKTGTFDAKLTAINTANKKTEATFTFTVHATSITTAAPGFELFSILIGLISVIWFSRRRKFNY